MGRGREGGGEGGKEGGRERETRRDETRDESRTVSSCCRPRRKMSRVHHSRILHALELHEKLSKLPLVCSSSCLQARGSDYVSQRLIAVEVVFCERLHLSKELVECFVGSCTVKSGI